MASTEDSQDAAPKLAVVEIAGDDDLARAIFHKTSFEADAVSINALLAFRGNRNADGSFDESLFLLRLTTTKAIHKDGCASAVIMNDRARSKRIRKNLPPDPVAGEDKRYYCGFTRAKALALRLDQESYTVDMKHVPEIEIDIYSHVSLYLRPKGDKKLVANDLTEAGRLLALAFGNPEGWICEIDAKDPQHPIAIGGVAVLAANDQA